YPLRVPVSTGAYGADPAVADGAGDPDGDAPGASGGTAPPLGSAHTARGRSRQPVSVAAADARPAHRRARRGNDTAPILASPRRPAQGWVLARIRHRRTTVLAFLSSGWSSHPLRTSLVTSASSSARQASFQP